MVGTGSIPGLEQLLESPCERCEVAIGLMSKVLRLRSVDVTAPQALVEESVQRVKEAGGFLQGVGVKPLDSVFHHRIEAFKSEEIVLWWALVIL